MRSSEVQGMLANAAPGFQGEEPVLLLVDGQRATALRGLAMRWHLFKHLGPAKAWNIWKRISEAAQPLPRTNGMSRRGMVGTVTAATAAFSVFAGLRTPAAAEVQDSAAQDDWLAQLDLRNGQELSGESLDHAWSKAQRSSEMQRLMSAELVGPPEEMNDLRSSTPEDSGAEELKAVTHQIAGTDGGELTALVWQKAEAVVLYYEATWAGQTQRRSIALQADEANSKAHFLAVVDKGELAVAANEPGTLANCSSDSDCSGACYTCRCTSMDVACGANCCVPCAFACGTVYSCIGCLGLWCPACLALNSCCTARSCRWRDSCA
ncbi:hypothetical protein [Nocardiopsis alborubida]|uniref:Uncharacterized protein n=1 Tax=Nocardiopsis alborubida TaxID=146802 RepID=A0A7X6RQ49_9ACTN|nr:hypothetical protein [Nocardiopsis alborubida]NKY97796.1 hypothetical protein [Nocardiopsis alborubida]